MRAWLASLPLLACTSAADAGAFWLGVDGGGQAGAYSLTLNARVGDWGLDGKWINNSEYQFTNDGTDEFAVKDESPPDGANTQRVDTNATVNDSWGAHIVRYFDGPSNDYFVGAGIMQKTQCDVVTTASDDTKYCANREKVTYPSITLGVHLRYRRPSTKPAFRLSLTSTTGLGLAIGFRF